MQKSDTGVNINLLQEYLFIPLDIFKKNQQNENRSVKIENRLEAWLAFFCMDDPETIIEIIEKYPDFKEMYEQAYDVCRNIEEVMQMFSKELLELDRNTVNVMIDMQKEMNKRNEVHIHPPYRFPIRLSVLHTFQFPFPHFQKIVSSG